RKVRPSDFAEFDLILGMDRSNVEDLKRLAGPARDKVHLFIDYATGSARDVPDPYYGGPEGFEQVYRMIRDASEALVDRLGARASAVSGQASSMM
ncbi:low molecular weight phosphotyrosine protein phosphatase, partial [Salmonella enterica subsp. enterica]|nr:low molecular weight phosphotyrosine protein phosphatase [Salmonella enterica subsp. enterica]